MTVNYPDSRGVVIVEERLRIDLFSYSYDIINGSEVSYIFGSEGLGFKVSSDVPLIGGVGFNFDLEFGLLNNKKLGY